MQLKSLPITSIRVNPNQPRKNFSLTEIEELAASIAQVGLLQPLVVTKANHGFLLVAGERRLRALEHLGRKEATALVTSMNDITRTKASLVENLQRVDLSPIEVAKAYQHLMHSFDLTQEQLGTHLGKHRVHIAQYVRLLQLPNPIQEALHDGSLSMGHAKALLALQNPDKQLSLFFSLQRKPQTVRQLEKSVKKAKSTPLMPKETDCFRRDLEERLLHRFGTRVQIQEKEGKGKVIISFDSLGTLETLLETWGVQEN